MVGVDMLMLTLGLWSLLVRARGKRYELVAAPPRRDRNGSSGFVGVLAGWVTTEIGRQPFTVYNLLRTAYSASPLAAPAIGASLVAFVVVYFAVFGFGTWYILKHTQKGAAARTGDPRRMRRPAPPGSRPPGPEGRAARWPLTPTRNDPGRS